jgi:hypothetical protein
MSDRPVGMLRRDVATDIADAILGRSDSPAQEEPGPEVQRAMTTFWQRSLELKAEEAKLLGAENLLLRGLLSEVLGCWRSRPLMDGNDQGHFDQRGLRDLRPRLRAAVPYDESPTDPHHGGKIP